MKPPEPLKHFAVAFVIALIVYVIFYSWIEHRRTRQGPWQMTFTNQTGTPALIVNEPELHITNVTFLFPRQPSTSNGLVRFDQPQEVPVKLPFGECIFMDTTFQPGTLVLKIFGHDLQLLPRALSVDWQEHVWNSGATFTLTSAPVNKANTSPGVP